MSASADSVESQVIDALDTMCQKYGFDALILEKDIRRGTVFITARRLGYEIIRALAKIELTEAKDRASLIGCALQQMADALARGDVQP